MTDPKRLLDEDGDEATLLRSAEADGPSPGLESRVLGALRSAPTPPLGGSASLVKGIGIATLAAVGVGAALMLLRPAATAPATTPATPTASDFGESKAPEAPPMATTIATESAPAPSTDASTADAATPGTVGSVPRNAADAGARSGFAPAATRGEDLAAEMAALDACRRNFGAGDAPQALQCLGGYQSRFPKGTLAQEATVLRIEVLASAGRREEARRVADAFLRAHPESAHRQRIQSIVLERPGDGR